MRWDPKKKPPGGGNLFLFIGGWTPCFTILFSYDSQLPQLRIQLCPTKKNGSTTPILFFFFKLGVLVIGRRDYAFGQSWLLPRFHIITLFDPLKPGKQDMSAAEIRVGQNLGPKKLFRFGVCRWFWCVCVCGSQICFSSIVNVIG